MFRICSDFVKCPPPPPPPPPAAALNYPITSLKISGDLPNNT